MITMRSLLKFGSGEDGTYCIYESNIVSSYACQISVYQGLKEVMWE
jgi:hypothetical protein